MATVKCRSCGKTYRYIGDTCPSCGAYNRAPSREYVAPDGTVHLLEQGEKVCYEQKECYERKECHEDVARQVRKAPKAPMAAKMPRATKAPRAVALPVESSTPRRVKANPPEKNHPVQGRGKALMLIGVLAALVPLVMNVITDLRQEAQPPVPDVSEQTEYTEIIELTVGDVFDAYGEQVSVERWAVSQDDPTTLVLWIRQKADYDLGVNFIAWEEEGMESEYRSADECFRDGDWMCYVFYDLALTPPYGAELEIYAGSGGIVYVHLGDGIGETAFSGGK